MQKLTSDLMTINKIIIFCENLIQDDVDGFYFCDKLNFDIDFINIIMKNIFEEYTKNYTKYEKDNLIKSYFSSLKRYLKLLCNIEKNINIQTKFSISVKRLGYIQQSLKERIELITNHGYRSTLVNTEKQCINEEEYNILLSDFQNSLEENKK